MGLLSLANPKKAKDLLLGKPPKAEFHQKSLVSPGQENALNQLLAVLQGDISGGVDSFEGPLAADRLDVTNTSLAALEERALQAATGGTPLQQATQKSLLELVQNQGRVGGEGNEFEEFFRTNVQDPLSESLDENLLQTGRRFAGTNLFGSERAEADRDVREDFITQLTRSRGDLAFRERESQADRLMNALQLSQQLAQNDPMLAELLQIGEFGEGVRRQDQAGIDTQFESFLQDRKERDAQVQRMLQAIGIPTLENIVVSKGGRQGILGPLLKAFAASKTGGGA